MNRQSQQGLTTVGWILVIAIFGGIVLTIFKVVPMYLEYFQVKSVLESVVTDDTIDPRSKRDLWNAIQKRLVINQAKSVKRENLTFKRAENVTTITVDYKVEKPYIAQLFIGAHFVYSVEIDR